MEYFNISGKTAIITGGSGVLGGEMAIGLAKAGVKVGVLGRSQQKLDNIVSQIFEIGGSGLALQADVLSTEQLESARSKLMGNWGQLDILINGAGGNMKGATIFPEQTIFDLSLDDFDQVTDLNLKGTILPTMVFGRMMADQKSGSIINISSVSARLPLTRVFGYSAAKAAIDNATKWLAAEMALKFGEGIRVNAIAPGFFVADQNRALLLNDDGTLTERGQKIISNTPMKRFGDPKELIGAIHWLSSEAAKFVTGAIIPIDGGFTAFSGV